MFSIKEAKPSTEEKQSTICQKEAETLYRAGTHNCAEAVMEAIRKQFIPDVSDAVVATVSGFGGGSGSGCLCGAVASGTACIGLVLHNKKETVDMTKELHGWFKEKYAVTCCKIIRQSHKGACPVLTGEVAGKIAEMLGKR